MSQRRGRHTRNLSRLEDIIHATERLAGQVPQLPPPTPERRWASSTATPPEPASAGSPPTDRLQQVKAKTDAELRAFQSELAQNTSTAAADVIRIIDHVTESPAAVFSGFHLRQVIDGITRLCEQYNSSDIPMRLLFILAKFSRLVEYLNATNAPPSGTASVIATAPTATATTTATATATATSTSPSPARTGTPGPAVVAPTTAVMTPVRATATGVKATPTPKKEESLFQMVARKFREWKNEREEKEQQHIPESAVPPAAAAAAAAAQPPASAGGAFIPAAPLPAHRKASAASLDVPDSASSGTGPPGVGVVAAAGVLPTACTTPGTADPEKTTPPSPVKPSAISAAIAAVSSASLANPGAGSRQSGAFTALALAAALNSPAAGVPSPSPSPPESIDLLCRICEEVVPSHLLEEHSKYCSAANKAELRAHTSDDKLRKRWRLDDGGRTPDVHAHARFTQLITATEAHLLITAMEAHLVDYHPICHAPPVPTRLRPLPASGLVPSAGSEQPKQGETLGAKAASQDVNDGPVVGPTAPAAHSSASPPPPGISNRDGQGSPPPTMGRATHGHGTKCRTVLARLASAPHAPPSPACLPPDSGGCLHPPSCTTTPASIPSASSDRESGRRDTAGAPPAAIIVTAGVPSASTAGVPATATDAPAGASATEGPPSAEPSAEPASTAGVPAISTAGVPATTTAGVPATTTTTPSPTGVPSAPVTEVVPTAGAASTTGVTSTTGVASTSTTPEEEPVALSPSLSVMPPAPPPSPHHLLRRGSTHAMSPDAPDDTGRRLVSAMRNLTLVVPESDVAAHEPVATPTGEDEDDAFGHQLPVTPEDSLLLPTAMRSGLALAASSPLLAAARSPTPSVSEDGASLFTPPVTPQLTPSPTLHRGGGGGVPRPSPLALGGQLETTDDDEDEDAQTRTQTSPLLTPVGPVTPHEETPPPAPLGSPTTSTSPPGTPFSAPATPQIAGSIPAGTKSAKTLETIITPSSEPLAAHHRHHRQSVSLSPVMMPETAQAVVVLLPNRATDSQQGASLLRPLVHLQTSDDQAIPRCRNIIAQLRSGLARFSTPRFHPPPPPALSHTHSLKSLPQHMGRPIPDHTRGGAWWGTIHRCPCCTGLQYRGTIHRGTSHRTRLQYRGTSHQCPCCTGLQYRGTSHRTSLQHRGTSHQCPCCTRQYRGASHQCPCCTGLQYRGTSHRTSLQYRGTSHRTSLQHRGTSHHTRLQYRSRDSIHHRIRSRRPTFPPTATATATPPSPTPATAAAGQAPTCPACASAIPTHVK
ncbi:hypothetical protein PAPYR_11151 [Paratrimastix pyriformis]|uniref:Uncharacterized protein n=1 Tax=Paratrimastix pyriformis TaxID=342808 RepID=A0ABQ8U9E4_9EUKA|nr:hypothetical protein PAPYR_11151 [Paratrimastix pyriformis]